MVNLSNKSARFYSKSKQFGSPFINSGKYGKQKLYEFNTLGIPIGKTYPQMKLKRLRKVKIWIVG